MRMPLVLTSLALVAVAPTSCSQRLDPQPSAPAPAPAVTAPEPAVEPTYRVPVDDLQQMGDATALVTIVAFTDYECHFCRRAEQTISRLVAEYGSDVRIAIAERPLPMHDRARPAALAALAAAEQGRYAEMRARLYASPALDDAALSAAAAAAGLDLARFEASLRSGSAARALARSEALADRLGVGGTPTFFVNGIRVVGAQPFETFKRVVDERLAGARAIARSGVPPRRVYESVIKGGLERVKDVEEPAAEAVVTVPTAGAPARGPSSAANTVVIFTDFECPYCARAQKRLEELERAHPGKIRVVFKNRPLPMHGNARLAARAAAAADAQGRFWEYHDVLFAHQSALDRASLVRYAVDLGLDASRFARDLDDPRLDRRIDADMTDAEALGVTGTPIFFVNGHRVVGAQPVSKLERWLEPC